MLTHCKIIFDQELSDETIAKIIDARKYDNVPSTLTPIKRDPAFENVTTIIVTNLFARIAWICAVCVRSHAKHNLGLETRHVQLENGMNIPSESDASGASTFIEAA